MGKQNKNARSSHPIADFASFWAQSASIRALANSVCGCHASEVGQNRLCANDCPGFSMSMSMTVTGLSSSGLLLHPHTNGGSEWHPDSHLLTRVQTTCHDQDAANAYSRRLSFLNQMSDGWMMVLWPCCEMGDRVKHLCSLSDDPFLPIWGAPS